MNPKDLQEMMTQAQQMQRQLQQQMQQTTVEASAGGGAVSVKVNGQRQVLSVTIDPELLKGGDVEMLQDLIVAAINEAGRRAEEQMKSSLGGMLGGLNLPGLS